MDNEDKTNTDTLIVNRIFDREEEVRIESNRRPTGRCLFLLGILLVGFDISSFFLRGDRTRLMKRELRRT
ncbi:Uncharacterized protein APZ42_017512 [Daphnia magna]|uniref:Uncharacterized protein n=1 Tax=Daphnia magna TaxID=35525 RepID=A0A164ZWT2_9CRUS|nr:Uncharacterized protein APZ42_017512 [Daphnia magna]